MSFYHNLFAREHNTFVDEFRKQAALTPDADSGLRNPANPRQVITYSRVTPEELFEVARLVVSAEIAKVHTIEWTTQLLYNEPLYRAMNSNWSGLIDQDKYPVMKRIVERIRDKFKASRDPKDANVLASAVSSGPGIIATGANKELIDEGTGKWNPEIVNGGTNHFGSPFNFPEDFRRSTACTRSCRTCWNSARSKTTRTRSARRWPVIDTFRGKATARMHDGGLANWALTMGRQRLGLLTLRNHPQFLQNLDLTPRLDTETSTLPPSTSSATASVACPASTNCAGRSACVS